MKAEKVRKELVRIFGQIQGHKRSIANLENEIREVQLKCPHEVVNDFDYDPRFIPKKICQDCGMEL